MKKKFGTDFQAKWRLRAGGEAGQICVHFRDGVMLQIGDAALIREYGSVGWALSKKLRGGGVDTLEIISQVKTLHDTFLCITNNMSASDSLAGGKPLSVKIWAAASQRETWRCDSPHRTSDSPCDGVLSQQHKSCPHQWIRQYHRINFYGALHFTMRRSQERYKFARELVTTLM